MLPKIKNGLIAGLAAVTLMTGAAAPALAWGKKEQGFVAGAGAAIIVDQLIRNGQHRKQHSYQQPRYAPAPQQYYQAPQYVAPRHTFVEPRRSYASSVYSTPAAQAFKSYSAAERRAIQRNLRSAGYYHGGIDGAFGPGTYNAIVAYARDAGVSGNLRSTNGAFAVYDGVLF